LAGALQEYLDDPNFEQNRIEYKTNKEAAERNAKKNGTVSSKASAACECLNVYIPVLYSVKADHYYSLTSTCTGFTIRLNFSNPNPNNGSSE
jgi:hypothetical protein